MCPTFMPVYYVSGGFVHITLFVLAVPKLKNCFFETQNLYC